MYDKIDKNGPYSEAEAKEIVVQIIAAVDYLHQNKIAHRDLKVITTPTNNFSLKTFYVLSLIGPPKLAFDMSESSWQILV